VTATVGLGVGYGLGYASRNDEVTTLKATSVTTLAALRQTQPHDVDARTDIAARLAPLAQNLPHDVAARTTA